MQQLVLVYEFHCGQFLFTFIYFWSNENVFYFMIFAIIKLIKNENANMFSSVKLEWYLIFVWSMFGQFNLTESHDEDDDEG